MCRLITVGSGSSGNTYLLQCGEETLVLDCGMRLLDTKKLLNFNIRGIVGALCTHAHGDHAKYWREYCEAGMYVWHPYLLDTMRDHISFGGFKVMSFPLVHDVPCVGYLIGHKNLGKMLYATDTEYIRYRFRNLNTILIEMNHSDEYIDRDSVKYAHAKKGHLEKQTTLDFIKANMNEGLNHVILCHLSADGADPVEFREAVKEIVHPWTTVDVAEPGSVIDLREIPF